MRKSKKLSAAEWSRHHPRERWSNVHRIMIGQLVYDLLGALDAEPLLLWGNHVEVMNPAIPEKIKHPLEGLCKICISEVGARLYEDGRYD